MVAHGSREAMARVAPMNVPFPPKAASDSDLCLVLLAGARRPLPALTRLSAPDPLRTSVPIGTLPFSGGKRRLACGGIR